MFSGSRNGGAYGKNLKYGGELSPPATS